MALTAEEKERRKIATNARNRAYHARCRERTSAKEDGRRAALRSS